MAKRFAGDKGSYFIMLKDLIHQEDITILNPCAHNNPFQNI